MPLLLSLDFGTSALKLSVFNHQLNEVDTQRESYFYTILPDEKIEEDPQDLMGAMVTACRRIPEKIRSQIELICYDTYAPSLLLMDNTGAPLSPVVTHMDRRSRKQSEFICSRMGKVPFQKITGVYPFTGGVSLTSLLWFMQNMPNLCSRIHKIGHLPTYIHYQLTKEWIIDVGNASMTGLYDTVGQSGWSNEILNCFNVPLQWQCPIVLPGTIAGGLQPHIAKKMGLTPGIPVAAGTHDVIASHAGAGNNRSGQILNNAGSSDMISILTDRPLLHDGYYLRSAGKQGLWQIYATTSGGFAVEWFRKQFCKELDVQTFYTNYLPSCAGISLPSTLYFEPYLAEDRQSLERRLAAWHGLTLGTTREQLLAALLYSMQSVLGNVIKTVEKMMVLDKDVKISGGLVNDSILCLKRSVFGSYQFRFKENCAVLGNVLLALGNKP